jgi:plastocyanin
MPANTKPRAMVLAGVLFLCGGSGSTLQAQGIAVTGTVTVTRATGARAGKMDNANAVIWLKPVKSAATRSLDPAAPARFKMLQQHKRFDPHVLVVPAGSVVEFPNLDPFFHNVFSMFDSKRFDLGLYEAGASHSTLFDRAGVCYIFCNIHPEMSGVVVVVESPYYALSNKAGEFSIPNVTPGRYLVAIWHERGKLEAPEVAPREITVSRENASLPMIRLIDSGQIMAPHKNKYGHDYDSPATSPVYK